MDNPFLKYMMRKEKKADIFHSSAYGKAQSGGVMGSASVGSFSDRMKMDRNRTVVKRYDDSKLVAGAKDNGPRAKKYTSPENEVGLRVGKKMSDDAATKREIQSANAPVVPKVNLGVKK